LNISKITFEWVKNLAYFVKFWKANFQGKKNGGFKRITFALLRIDHDNDIAVARNPVVEILFLN